MTRALLTAALLLSAPAAHGRQDGVPWYSGEGDMDCNACHVGGEVPVVEILGPTDVEAGSVSTYTLRVSGGQRDGAGYNLSGTEGTLATPVGDLRSRIRDDQLTHRVPSTGGDLHEWTFDWTAPAWTTDVTFYAAGNSVRRNGVPDGDRGATATFEIHVTGGPCPDRDADGFEDAACNPDAGGGGGDCRDTAPRIHPDAEESCDGLDDDCNGEPDDACAADGGWGTGTQPNDLLHELESPERCALCHANFGDEAPSDGWEGTLMANGARDPLFLAALSAEDQDGPGTGERCIRCHAPAAWLAGATDPAEIGIEEEAGEQGVICGVCHRAIPATDLDENAPYLGNALFFLDDGFTQYGPYVGSPSPHSNDYAAHQRSSELCGACHDATNDGVEAVDADTGEALGWDFPLDRTYSEWRASAFGARGEGCRSCHMPVVAGFAAAHRDAPERDEVALHQFAGANAWTLDAIRARGLGVSARLEAGAEAARAKLREAATIELRGAPVSVAAEAQAEVTFRVTNWSGHRLPTGHPLGRRMWIQVTAGPDEGDPFFTSGAYDETEAILDRDPQLRTYEARIGSADEEETLRLAAADRFVEDTRLPPEGYAPTPDIAPVGRDYSDGTGGIRNWDDVTYRIPIPAGAKREVVLTARVLYQSATREYVESLRDGNETDARGDELGAVWEETGRSPPEEIATVSIRIPVERRGDGGCGCRAPGRVLPSGLGLCALGLIVAFGRRRSALGRSDSPVPPPG